MVGVTGSIPVAPTSLRLLRKLRLGKPPSVYRSEASEGCSAEAPWAKAGSIRSRTAPKSTPRNPRDAPQRYCRAPSYKLDVGSMKRRLVAHGLLRLCLQSVLHGVVRNRISETLLDTAWRHLRVASAPTNVSSALLRSRNCSHAM